MLLLTSASDQLQVVTGAAVTVDAAVAWVDAQGATIVGGSRQVTNISTAATTNIAGTVPASTQRAIESVSIRNKHASTACAVTVQQFDGTNTAELVKVTLAAGEMLEYESASGWQLLDAAGNLKQGLTPSVGLLRGIINVLDYGAKGDGATDDKVAIQAAINAAGAGGVSARGVDVWFPPGVYLISGTLTCPFNNVILHGAGWQSTVLLANFTTGDILQLGDGTAHNGCGLMDMSVWCNAARTTGASINVNLMHDVILQNFVINNYFQGILIQGASLKSWIHHGQLNNGHAADGVGIQVTNGAGGDTYITDLVMSNNPASKPLAGIQITQTGHTSILRCNVTSFVKGLSVNPGASQDVNYLFIDHSLFDSCGTHGAQFSPTNATGRIRSVICVNSWFSGTTTAGAATNGIEIGPGTASSAVDGLSFIGCRILNNQRHGVGITYASAQNISFTDCTVAGNGQETINTYDGISIAANVNNITVMNCGLGQQGTATNQQRYAANIAAGTSANLMFLGNQCAPNGTVGTHGYINSGTLTGGNNVIDGNSPQPMQGMGASTVAASAAINTVETVISAALRLAANGLRAQACVRIKIDGSCTVSTAAAVPGRFIVRLGTAGTTADTAIMTFTLPTSGGVGTSAFHIEITVTCRTIGAAGTFQGGLFATQGSATLGLLAAVAWALAGTAAAGNTQNANYLTVTFGNTGSANVTCTFQKVSTEVYVA